MTGNAFIKKGVKVAWLVLYIFLSFCSRGQKESTEMNPSNSGLKSAQEAAQADPEKKSSKETGSSGAGEPAPDEAMAADPSAAESPAPALPDISGFSGMDPDLFPDGEEGLNAIVELWKSVGEDAKKKVDAQTEAQAGKKLRTPKELAKCFPDSIKDWKASGKITTTRQKHRGVTLSMASGIFRQGDEISASLTIMDTLATSEIRVGFEMGLAITKKVKSPRQKLITIADEQGYILVRDAPPDSLKKSTSKGALLLADRFLIIVNIENLADFDETCKILSSIKTDKITKLDK